MAHVVGESVLHSQRISRRITRNIQETIYVDAKVTVGFVESATSYQCITCQ